MQQSEPVFNVPAVVLWLIGTAVAAHVALTVLPVDTATLTFALAFVPARYTSLVGSIPGGEVARYTSPLTHLFVHGEFKHLAANCAWLLAFGPPVARRTTPGRFLLFYGLCGVAGAAVYALLDGLTTTLLIGASGAISGLMGAAFRFMYAAFAAGPGAFSGRIPPPALPSLGDSLRDRRIIFTILAFCVMNLLLAVAAPGLTDAGGIAWQAHLGGFFAGFLLYGWFDRPPAVFTMPDDDRAAPDADA